MTPTKTAAPHTTGAKPLDAIALLEADHEEMDRLFAAYAKTHVVADKEALVTEICTALGMHVQIEEEIFYPAIRKALKDKLLVPEATVEHQGVKDLMVQLEQTEPGDVMYDARVKVLAEYVKHHVKEEHTEMFPQAKASSIDMQALGARMSERKDELLAQVA